MDHADYLTQLRDHGHRLTPQRERVLAAVCEIEGHISAEEILRCVRKRYPSINKSAVYRTLDLLTRLGFVNPTDLGQGRVEYEVHRHPHHHHLVCRRCHAMIEAEDRIFDSLEKALRKDYGFSADLDHFAIFGMCAKCKKATARPAQRASSTKEKNHAHS